MTIFFVLVSFMASAGAEVTDWPSIEPVSAVAGFSRDSEKFELVVPITGENGVDLYFLRCVGGSDRYLDGLSTETDANYVGPLSCRLSLEDQYGEYSLLAEDGSPRWYTRGQFHYRHLVGACGEYPEFGRVRNFYLRGMRLTLAIEGLERDDSGEVQFFELHVDAQNDESASTAIAARPDYLNPHKPGRSCDVVLDGQDTRYCRDRETYSWIECPEQG